MLSRFGPIMWVAAMALAAPILATPSAQMAASVSEPLSIPFSPPLDRAVQYRNEKTVTKGGQSVTNWSVESYRFEKLGDNFRLTITPVDFGSDEKDPDKLAIMKQLGDLMTQPYVLKLGPDGEILELENADKYWAIIIQTLKDHLGGKASSERERGAVKTVIDTFQAIPPSSRLALLSEVPQTVVEFGGFEIEPGETISGDVESESPFGGTLKRTFTVSLKSADAAYAIFTMDVTIPRKELDQLVQAMVERLKPAFGNDTEKMKAGLAAIKDFRHQSMSEYQIIRSEGLLGELSSTETIEATDKGKKTVRITRRNVRRLP